MTSPIQPVPPGRPSFLDMPRLERLDQLEADVAILTVPYGVPYDMEGSRFDFVEVAPARDPVGITSLHAARLILNLIGALAHTGQIGRARAGCERT